MTKATVAVAREIVLAMALSTDDLRHLIADLESHLARQEYPAPQRHFGYGDGHLEIKVINGHQYAYRRYKRDGRLRSQYLGRADKYLAPPTTLDH